MGESAMRRKLPPLNAVRAFEAAARNGGFTRAAEELRVSQGAISRHIFCLEQWLVKLFTRVHRGVELTPQGTAFFNVTRSAMDLLETGSAHLRRSPDEDRLRLKLPPTFAMRWLIPRLVRFHAQHPNTERADHDLAHQRGFRPRGCRYWHLLLARAAHWRGIIDECPERDASSRLLRRVCSTACRGCARARGSGEPRPALFAQPSIRLANLGRRCRVSGHIDGNGGLKFENAALAYQAAIDGAGVMMAQ